MPDHADAGKGARVVGFFVFQLGAGVIFDSSADAWGAAIAICGLAILAGGIARIASRRSRATSADGAMGGPSTC
jgi:hypothetical protein